MAKNSRTHKASCEDERTPAKRTATGTSGFAAAWAVLGAVARDVLALGQEGFAERRGAIGTDADRIDRILTRTATGAPVLSPDEARLFEAHGLESLLLGMMCRAAIADPAFRTAVARVWSHPRVDRTPGWFVAAATVWGLSSDDTRTGLLGAIRAVAEGKRPLTQLEQRTLDLFTAPAPPVH